MAIAVLAPSPRTAWIGALGVGVLYGEAVASYGLFHILDYPIFLGVAAYIFMCSHYGDRTAVLADAVLRSFTAITLLWAGIEKFACPEWSFTLLKERCELTFGLNPEFYMVAAGFMEFCAAYLLISGRLASRLASLVLLVFFIAAIVPFGALEAVGIRSLSWWWCWRLAAATWCRRASICAARTRRRLRMSACMCAS